MPLEEEMRHELKKLEEELFLIDKEINKLAERLNHLIMEKRKKERDLKILRSHFHLEAIEKDETEKDMQTTLAGMK